MTPSYYDMTCTPASVDPVLPIGFVILSLTMIPNLADFNGMYIALASV